MAVLVLIVILAAVHLLPQLRNPFTTTTTVRSGPAVLKSITALSRYEAASGNYQVVVDLSTHTAFLPSFIAGQPDAVHRRRQRHRATSASARLKGSALTMNAARTAVTVRLPAAQLEPAALNVGQSYVYAEQQGLLNRVTTFFSGNPNSQQAVYIAAQQKIQNAAVHSGLAADAERNTQDHADEHARVTGVQARRR